MFPRFLTLVCHHIGDMLDQTPYAAEPCVPLFALNGLYAGPRLVVVGPDAMMRAVADLFWDRRDLANLRGSVILRGEGVDTSYDQADDTLAISPKSESTQHVFLEILGRMTALGMITGRGVPLRWVA